MCASVLKYLVSFDRAEAEKEGANSLMGTTELTRVPAVVAHLGSLLYLQAGPTAWQVTLSSMLQGTFQVLLGWYCTREVEGQ